MRSSMLKQDFHSTKLTFMHAGYSSTNFSRNQHLNRYIDPQVISSLKFQASKENPVLQGRVSFSSSWCKQTIRLSILMRRIIHVNNKISSNYLIGLLSVERPRHMPYTVPNATKKHPRSHTLDFFLKNPIDTDIVSQSAPKLE
jgi:hypothetical protein